MHVEVWAVYPLPHSVQLQQCNVYSPLWDFLNFEAIASGSAISRAGIMISKFIAVPHALALASQGLLTG